MTPERAKELLPVITAFAEGKKIQYRHRGAVVMSGWGDADMAVFSDDCDYRIKPKPRRVFVNEYFGPVLLEPHLGRAGHHSESEAVSNCGAGVSRVVEFVEVVK